LVNYYQPVFGLRNYIYPIQTYDLLINPNLVKSLIGENNKCIFMEKIVKIICLSILAGALALSQPGCKKNRWL